MLYINIHIWLYIYSCMAKPHDFVFHVVCMFRKKHYTYSHVNVLILKMKSLYKNEKLKAKQIGQACKYVIKLWLGPEWNDVAMTLEIAKCCWTTLKLYELWQTTCLYGDMAYIEKYFLFFTFIFVKYFPHVLRAWYANKLANAKHRYDDSIIMYSFATKMRRISSNCYDFRDYHDGESTKSKSFKCNFSV